MKLHIYNLGKIQKAEIDIDGITVIAGSNNTGKSTVGKSIFSLFNSLTNMESKVLAQKTTSIRTLCRRVIRDLLAHKTALGESARAINNLITTLSRSIATSVMEEYQKSGEIFFEDVQPILREALEKAKIMPDADEADEMFVTFYTGICEILELSEVTISQALVTRYFDRVFNSQINTLQKSEKAIITLELKKRNVSIEFLNHKCVSLNSEIAILHKAIYIDNPFVVDMLDDVDYGLSQNPLVDLLDTQYSMDDGHVIESVLAEEKMDAVFNMLSSVVKGRILVQDGSYFLEDEDIDQPISIKNLSSGLKSFVLLKMLVESGVICNNDVLVLDEPEIHLHPEWQIVYAELIVLLQKYLNLSVIVTTHSPYFLDAIDLFSKKHKVVDRTNYYLSHAVGNQIEFQCVSDDIGVIYKEMASPIDVLETLRYELTEE